MIRKGRSLGFALLLSGCASAPESGLGRGPASTKLSPQERQRHQEACRRYHTKQGLPPLEFLQQVAAHHKELWTDDDTFTSRWAAQVHDDLDRPDPRLVPEGPTRSNLLSVWGGRDHWLRRRQALTGAGQGLGRADLVWFHENLERTIEFAKAYGRAESLSEAQYQRLWRLTDKYHGPQVHNRHFATTEVCYGVDYAPTKYVTDEYDYPGVTNALFSARNWAIELYQILKAGGGAQ